MAPAALRNRTLVVDDDPAIRLMWHRSLKLASFDVVVASSATEGLARLGNDPTIGLVLLDLMMPGMDGWAFLRAQRSDPSLSTIPTVVLSGSVRPREQEATAATFLQKPVCRDHLLSVVATYCQPVAD